MLLIEVIVFLRILGLLFSLFEQLLLLSDLLLSDFLFLLSSHLFCSIFVTFLTSLAPFLHSIKLLDEVLLLFSFELSIKGMSSATLKIEDLAFRVVLNVALN